MTPARPERLEEVLAPRVPPERRPRIKTLNVLATCGKSARLIEAKVEGLRTEWGNYGLYEQDGHAGMAIIELETPDGVFYPMVIQPRPTDEESVECPAGNIGEDISGLFDQMLEEIKQEVGEVEIVRVESCRGFSHNVAREVVPAGGPKCFFLFKIKAKSTRPLPPRFFEEGDETTKSHCFTRDEVRDMVREGRIADIVTSFFLLLTGTIEASDIGLTDISGVR